MSTEADASFPFSLRHGVGASEEALGGTFINADHIVFRWPWQLRAELANSCDLGHSD